MKFFTRFRGGYTLIELMVVVVIMAISAGTLIAFSRLGQSQTVLYVETSKVIDVILRSKSLAISAYRDPSLGNRATCAHGLSLDLSGAGNSFSLNRYLKNETVPVPCAEINSTISSVPLSNRYERKVAESSTYVLSGDIVFEPSGTTVSDIVFRPPDPQILFFDAGGILIPAGSGEILLRDLKTDQKVRIVVGQGGQVTYNFLD